MQRTTEKLNKEEKKQNVAERNASHDLIQKTKVYTIVLPKYF